MTLNFLELITSQENYNQENCRINKQKCFRELSIQKKKAQGKNCQFFTPKSHLKNHTSLEAAHNAVFSLSLTSGDQFCRPHLQHQAWT